MIERRTFVTKRNTDNIRINEPDYNDNVSADNKRPNHDVVILHLTTVSDDESTYVNTETNIDPNYEYDEPMDNEPTLHYDERPNELTASERSDVSTQGHTSESRESSPLLLSSSSVDPNSGQCAYEPDDLPDSFCSESLCETKQRSARKPRASNLRGKASNNGSELTMFFDAAPDDTNDNPDGKIIEGPNVQTQNKGRTMRDRDLDHLENVFEPVTKHLKSGENLADNRPATFDFEPTNDLGIDLDGQLPAFSPTFNLGEIIEATAASMIVEDLKAGENGNSSYSANESIPVDAPEPEPPPYPSDEARDEPIIWESQLRPSAPVKVTKREQLRLHEQELQAAARPRHRSMNAQSKSKER